MRIRVIPSGLSTLASRWRQVAHGLEEVEGQVQRAWNSLDWEVRQTAGLEAQVIQARRQALALREEALRLARFLEERAAAFEQVDQEGSHLLGQTTARWMALAGGPQAFRLPPALSFPTARVRPYLRLGNLTGGPAPRWDLLRVEPGERRALLEWGTDTLISRLEPLGLLKDLLDVARLPAWQRRVDEARRAWETALRRSGSHSPQAREAYGRYVEAMIFEMPFLGDRARALVALLNILGRVHPVE